MFAASYLATDVLSEIYGSKAARKGIYISFFAFLLWNSILLLTLSFKPASTDWAQPHMKAIFLPMPIFLIASIVSYMISQFNDIAIFSFLKKQTKSKHLWLRNNVSTIISGLVDNTVFSMLAFFVIPRFLTEGHLLSIDTVIFTYILGTYVFRVMSAIFDTPFMYLARRVLAPQILRKQQYKDD